MSPNLDPWEAQYIKDLKDYDLLAWDDQDAWERNKQQQWVYNKKYVWQKYNKFPCWELDEIPKDAYPVFIKPQINLDGMGKGARVAYSPKDLPKYGPTMFAMPILTELPQTSWDIVIRNGKYCDSFGFYAHRDDNGSFVMFESLPFTHRPPKQRFRMLAESIGIERGVINVEFIGNTIIEMHLRPSIQFYDICGGLLERLPRLIKSNHWDKVYYEKTYSTVWRRKDDGRPALTGTPPKHTKNIRSTQFTWVPGKKLSDEPQDEYSFRYMVINGRDWYDVQRWGNEISNNYIRWD